MIGRQALHNGQVCPCKHYIMYSVRGQILELPFEILFTEQNQAKLAVAIINPILLKKIPPLNLTKCYPTHSRSMV